MINSLIRVLPQEIIRIDDDMNPIRDSNGFCIKCKTNEKGLLIGIIGNKINSSYSGYANNSSASKSKIIENVFKKGKRRNFYWAKN